MTAYLVDRVIVHDAERYGEYAKAAGAAIAKANPVGLARGKHHQIMEGPTKYNRYVVAMFDSLEEGVAAFTSPEYEEVAKIRRGGAGTNEAIVVEGVAEPGDDVQALWIAYSHVTNPDQYQKYLDAVAKLPPNPTTVLARGGRYQILEGDFEANRFVVVGWPSFEQAVEFFHSPGYQAAAAFRRDGGGDVGLAIVERE